MLAVRRDVDLAAVDLAGDLDEVRAIINDVLALAREDGLEFDTAATTAESIRDDDLYGGLRVSVHGALASAVIRFHVDVNLGDPLWPPPSEVIVPRLLGGPPIRINAYAIELVLAEKIVTALQRGTANTRWRDFVDVATLSRREIDDTVLVGSIRRVATFRQATIRPLSEVLVGYPDVAQQRWTAWRRKQGLAATTPSQFADMVDEVVEFADPLLARAAG
jgi:hypothetical protein